VGLFSIKLLRKGARKFDADAESLGCEAVTVQETKQI
jgi:hypothetical protein